MNRRRTTVVPYKELISRMIPPKSAVSLRRCLHQALVLSRLISAKTGRWWRDHVEGKTKVKRD